VDSKAALFKLHIRSLSTLFPTDASISQFLLSQERQADAEKVIERGIALETRHAREFAIRRGLDPDKYVLTPTSLPKLHLCRGEFDEDED